MHKHLEHLKVLEKAEELYAKESLENKHVYLLGIQHLTPTTLELFKKIINKGVPPEHIFLMGKCYSANPLIYNELAELGIQVSERCFYFNSHEPYDKTLRNSVFYFFKESVQDIDFEKCKKVILIDDGASLLSAATQLLPDDIEVVGIEQTSAGYRIAKEHELPFQIINVARSKAKLRHETTFICRMVCRKIKEHMEHIEFKVKNVLILGSGYIGQGVYEFLKSGFEVDIFDIKDHPNTKLTSDRLKKYDLIIGCAGVNSLSVDELMGINKDIALMSASSSDREFSASQLRSKISRYHYFSRNIRIDNIHLVNSGFPVNFDDSFLDSKELDLTRALLYTAVLQAGLQTFSRESGFVDVDHQEAYVQTFLDTYYDPHKQPSCCQMTEKEIRYPHMHKLLRALNYDAFSNFDQQISYHIQPHATFEKD